MDQASPTVPQVEQETYVQMDNGSRFYLWKIGITPLSQSKPDGDKSLVQ